MADGWTIQGFRSSSLWVPLGLSRKTDFSQIRQTRPTIVGVLPITAGTQRPVNSACVKSAIRSSLRRLAVPAPDLVPLILCTRQGAASVDRNRCELKTSGVQREGGWCPDINADGSSHAFKERPVMIRGMSGLE